MDSDCEYEAAAILFVLLGKKKSKRRSIWVKSWISQRFYRFLIFKKKHAPIKHLLINSIRYKHGVYTTLIPKLLATDPAAYKNFMRMDNNSFLVLLEKINPLIEKQSSAMRDSISPSERLSVTLRFLATGSCTFDIALTLTLA